MRVEQRRKQSLFGDISSMLRMYKTLAIGMLFGVFSRQIQQSRKMKIKSNSINHSQFSSCLRPYLLVKTPIRYPKTVQKASLKTWAADRCTLNRIRFTPNSIAACAGKQGAGGRLDFEQRAFISLKRARVISTTPISAMIDSGVSA